MHPEANAQPGDTAGTIQHAAGSAALATSISQWAAPHPPLRG